MPQNPVTARPPNAGNAASSFREVLRDSLRFWEYRRLFYNALLGVVVALWLTFTWPHFRPALHWNALLRMCALGLIANFCYCAAYFIDVPLLGSPVASLWRRRRWILWVVGTIFAIVLANYWIADEIYSFVPPN